MRRNKSAYWICQLTGWSTFILVWTFFYFAIRTKPYPFFFQSLFVDAICGFVITHIMRLVVINLKIIKTSLQKQIIAVLLISLLFSLLYSFCTIFITMKSDWEVDQMRNYSLLNKTLRNSATTFLYLLIWNLIYFSYHYIEKSRQEQLDKMKLETTVKELELKTIKSHINPHFIFNALNSIRALVDENPGRARTAITELSNILRSSMQAEKIETAPFERELNIVKDYLALEQIRFEDRLVVEYDIDEDTLDQPFPPMMLQTLVENAIKHGISKQINGGTVKIISDFVGNNHELIVRNTGAITSNSGDGGFGITSTHNRLNLLYGKQANFNLKNLNDGMVEAKVTIPVLI
ncbi:MAG: histidine kinase [Sphingobacteriia bacterium]|nr:histidine kinase [Sphingobacteriia bacterium]